MLTTQAPSQVRIEPATGRSGRKRPPFATTLSHLSPNAWAWLDAATIGLWTYVAYHLVVFGNPAFHWVASAWLSGACLCVAIVLCGIVFGLYEHNTLGSRSRIVIRVAMSGAAGVAGGYAIISLFFYADATRWVGFIVGVGYLAISLSLRLLAHEALTNFRARVLCIGETGSIERLVALMRSRRRQHYELVGCVRVTDDQTPPPPPDAPIRSELPCLGDVRGLRDLITAHQIDEVIVGTEYRSSEAVDRAILACLDRHCRVTDQPTFLEKVLREVPAESITAQWFLLADVQTPGGFEAAKRATDALASAIGLLLTLPLWPLIALLIRIDSRGPVLFSQTRVGLHGRPFTLYKFRTMRTDAEKNGAQWATQGDQRVTRIGRFLRQSRLDELPQLWNIMRGEMSLVGPRPERPEFVEQLSRELPHYRHRHLVKPGLTGWAQINFGYGASVQDSYRKLCFDLYYLKHRSIDLDFAIIVRTIGTFVTGAR